MIAGLSAGALTACGGGDDSELPISTAKNAYRQINLAANNARYNAKFTFADMVNAWGISIRPKGAGGHFWVTAGGKSFQFVGDVTRSADPKLQVLFQDGLAEVTIPGADAVVEGESVGKATGTVFNGADLNSDHFRVTGQTALSNGAAVEFDGSARFIFASDSGVITAWTDRAKDGSVVRVNGPTVEVFNGGDQGMAFFGLAINPKTWDALWAVDFGQTPQIRQFDKSWKLVP
ncbi:MAG: TIGR03118 family protein, partial [Burkholderiaceae bacterium]